MPATDHTRWIAEAMRAPDFEAPASILDLLNYQLHLTLSFSAADVVRLCGQQHGISRHEWGFVALLATFGPLAPSELAVRAGMDRSRTSKALMPLLAKGLIERRATPHDRRRATVALTDAGQRLHDRLWKSVLQIHHALLQPFSVAERRQLARLLDRLRRRAVALSTGAGAGLSARPASSAAARAGPAGAPRRPTARSAAGRRPSSAG